MIVPIFNYHLSIITIMGKNNKSLYINIHHFRYILKLIQNRLNRTVFHEDKLLFIQKQTLKSFFRPRWKAREIQVWRRCGDPDLRETEQGCELFICLV